MDGPVPQRDSRRIPGVIDMDIILNLTRRCNLRCYKCPVEKTGATMTWDTVVRALRFAEGAESPSVSFYGGEPTIESKLMLTVMDKALLELDRPRFGFTTNGMFLNRGLLLDLAGYPVSIALSHNGTRQASTRGMPLEADRAARLLLDFFPESTAMCTYWPRDVSSLEADVVHLAELGFKRISLNPDLKVGGWDIGLLEPTLLDILKDNRDIEFPGLQRGFVREACGSKDLFVDVDGTLYRCIAHPENRSYSIGDVFTGIRDDLNDDLNKRCATIPERCICCPVSATCGMRCSCVRILSTGGLTDVSDSVCEYEKMMYRIRRR